MNILKNKKGSSSVLIIMLLVVLMMFGLAILTTTLSNKNLSTRKQEWINDYYKLESNVSIELAEFDNKLQNIKEESLKVDKDRSESYKELLKKDIENIIIEEENYSLEIEVSEENGDYLKYIIVRVDIIVPDNSITNKEYLKEENYKITMYREMQDLFMYNDIEFGVPFFPTGD